MDYRPLLSPSVLCIAVRPLYPPPLADRAVAFSPSVSPASYAASFCVKLFVDGDRWGIRTGFVVENAVFLQIIYHNNGFGIIHK